MNDRFGKSNLMRDLFLASHGTPVTVFDSASDQDAGDRHPAAVITGETGTGRTHATKMLALEALRRGIPLFILSPRPGVLSGLQGWPGVEMFSTDAPSMAEAISYLNTAMRYRHALVRDGRVTPEAMPPVLLVVDEMPWVRRDLVSSGRAAAWTQLEQLMLMGRSSRIQACVCLARPSAADLPASLRDAAGFRLSMGRLTPENALQMWGDYAIGVDDGQHDCDPGRGTVSTEAGPQTVQLRRAFAVDLIDAPDSTLSEQDRQLLEDLRVECRQALKDRPTAMYLPSRAEHQDQAV